MGAAHAEQGFRPPRRESRRALVIRITFGFTVIERDNR
jgi:hypothetical protein